eukprot:6204350-Pleurochrysis_carterae.AAC.4
MRICTLSRKSCVQIDYRQHAATNIRERVFRDTSRPLPALACAADDLERTAFYATRNGQANAAAAGEGPEAQLIGGRSYSVVAELRLDGAKQSRALIQPQGSRGGSDQKNLLSLACSHFHSQRPVDELLPKKEMWAWCLRTAHLAYCFEHFIIRCDGSP